MMKIRKISILVFFIGLVAWSILYFFAKDTQKRGEYYIGSRMVLDGDNLTIVSYDSIFDQLMVSNGVIVEISLAESNKIK